jgi:hypothetical protein
MLTGRGLNRTRSYLEKRMSIKERRDGRGRLADRHAAKMDIEVSCDDAGQVSLDRVRPLRVGQA